MAEPFEFKGCNFLFVGNRPACSACWFAACGAVMQGMGRPIPCQKYAVKQIKGRSITPYISNLNF